MVTSRYTYVDPQSSQIYGTDIQLDAFGDFTANGNGDLGSVSGMINLIQAVKDR